MSISGHPAVDLVGITVSIAIGVHPDGSSLILAGHPDGVPGSDAAALVVAQIDVPLDGGTKKVWHPVIWRSLRKSRGNWCEVLALRVG